MRHRDERDRGVSIGDRRGWARAATRGRHERQHRVRARRSTRPVRPDGGAIGSVDAGKRVVPGAAAWAPAWRRRGIASGAALCALRRGVMLRRPTAGEPAYLNRSVAPDDRGLRAGRTRDLRVVRHSTSAVRRSRPFHGLTSRDDDRHVERGLPPEASVRRWRCRARREPNSRRRRRLAARTRSPGTSIHRTRRRMPASTRRQRPRRHARERETRVVEIVWSGTRKCQRRDFADRSRRCLVDMTVPLTTWRHMSARRSPRAQRTGWPSRSPRDRRWIPRPDRVACALATGSARSSFWRERRRVARYRRQLKERWISKSGMSASSMAAEVLARNSQTSNAPPVAISPRG